MFIIDGGERIFLLLFLPTIDLKGRCFVAGLSLFLGDFCGLNRFSKGDLRWEADFLEWIILLER